MKYLPLIWASLWRKKTRTIFTLMSIVIAFLLYGVLQTVDYAFENPGTGVTGADKLITTNRFSLTLLLPFSFKQQITSVPGVADVTWITWFGAYYQESKNFVFALPIDTDTYFNLHKDEFIVDADQMAAFRNSRAGAIVNVALMKKFGWKIGDKLPLHSTIWTQQGGRLAQLDFRHRRHIRRQGPDPGHPAGLHRPVPLRAVRRGTQLRQGPGRMVRGAHRRSRRNPRPFPRGIDALFANSPNETKTQPAKDFAMAFIKQFGDVGFVLRAILGAVFFTLLFLTGNTMMQSVRERIPELAVLKTRRLQRRKVLGLVIGESLLLCVLAADRRARR